MKRIFLDVQIFVQLFVNIGKNMCFFIMYTNSDLSRVLFIKSIFPHMEGLVSGTIKAVMIGYSRALLRPICCL